MKAFAQLIKELDSTNKTNQKVAALANYFKEAKDSDKVWTIALLSHRRPKRPVNTTLLRAWATELANIPLWLFEESYHIVGDLAETIALVLPHPNGSTVMSLTEVVNEIAALGNQSEAIKKATILEGWDQFNYYERFVYNKIITGGFRIGVSQKLMTRALGQATGIDTDELAFKLMGNWDPKTISFDELIIAPSEAAAVSRPYPFFLAHAVEGQVEELGDISQYSFEHKWDGIRAQVIFRANTHFVWSKGEELVTDKYPEFDALRERIPNGTVLDGEIVCFPDGQIGDFNMLQTRIGRKNISKELLETHPVILIAYDLLEWNGKDLRDTPFEKRRELLDKLVKTKGKNTPLYLSNTMTFATWKEAAAERERSREKRSEGLMIKRKDSHYGVGRKRGEWFKWKVDPFTIDAVLTYAMRGHGRRANLFTDYTFALWHEGALVTFAKAYSGLTDAELKEVDSWIKKNTLERFGPVRSVKPEHVFEIAFEGIATSKRHKSGISTRFPRIHRWRKDKNADQANSLEDLKALIPK